MSFGDFLSSRWRLIFLFSFLFFGFFLLILQFFRLQITEKDEWVKKANRQHFFVIKEPSMRGSFLSNTALRPDHPEITQKYVMDIQKFHLFIDPEALPQEKKEEIAHTLKQMLNCKGGDCLKFVEPFYKKVRSRKIASWLEREEKEAILQWWIPYAKSFRIASNAVYFVADYKRSYPFGKLLGQVLHTVQEVREQKTQAAIPTGGLELYFNKELQGKEGKRRLMRSPLNALETGEVIANPKHGADIYLTINHCLQAIVEEELERGVKKSRAKGGWAVMMDPKTGEILALAQYPFFYPFEFQRFFNDPLQIEHTKVKAITDAFEPGSITKPITCAIALLANEELKKRKLPPLFDPEEKVAVSKGFFPGRSKPLTDTSSHSFLNMNMAIQRSSNIYMAILAKKIVERLGSAWYRQALLHFGLGKRTGIELPSESIGFLPRLHKKHPNGALEWSMGTPYSLAIGYNFQATSLQMTRAIAILANGGMSIEPTLIKKICTQGSKIPISATTRKVERILPSEITKKVCCALQYVTKPGGTARKGDVFGYTEAGKTSTTIKLVNGQYSPTKRRSHFIGFTPVNDPAFVLSVTIDEPEYGYIPGIGTNHGGGACAAPVFREIAKKTLDYLGIPQDDPCGYPVLDPRYDPLKAHWLLETQELQEKYQSWNKKA